jgi:hypothetical protein
MMADVVTSAVRAHIGPKIAESPSKIGVLESPAFKPSARYDESKSRVVNFPQLVTRISASNKIRGIAI